MTPKENDIKTYQVRINSLNFPQLPSADYLETFNQTVEELSDSTYTYAQGALASHGQIIRQPLERNSFVGATSGLPVNASSALRISMTFATSAARTVYTMLKHLKVAKFILYDKVQIAV